MAFNYISAAEAANLIKHGYNIGLSGFTPAGTAKAVTAELAKIAEAEHAKGNPFQIGIFTGASTGDSCDGILSRAKAIRYRAPYTTNVDFRKAVNNGEIAYNDIHLSQMAQEVRYGFMGKVNVAVIEACEVTPDGKIYLTAAGGIAPTICRLADQIIVELNAAHSKNAMGLHDVYEPLDPPYRREIPIFKPSDRIGQPYIQVAPKKLVGIVVVLLLAVGAVVFGMTQYQKKKEAEEAGIKLKTKEIKKDSQRALNKAREEVGSISRKDRNIQITDKEWEAIQAGAISENKLKSILQNCDPDSLRQRAMPKSSASISAATANRIKAMSSSYTIQQIADKLGVSTSTVSKYLKGATA